MIIHTDQPPLIGPPPNLTIDTTFGGAGHYSFPFDDITLVCMS